MRAAIPITLLVFSFLFASGCASTQDSGFLENYSQLSDGLHLEKVMIAPGFTRDNLLIEVKEPDVSRIQTDAFFPKKEAQTYLSASLEEFLSAVSNVKALPSKYVSDRGPEHLLRLETAITEMEGGSRFGRFMAGELGLGHAHVQVEGKLFDTQTGKLLLAFADRRAGSATGGLDITGGDSRQLVESDLDGISRALAETLGSLKG